jgi:hypothetical protein
MAKQRLGGYRIDPVLQRPARKRMTHIMNSDSCKACSLGNPSPPLGKVLVGFAGLRILHDPLGLRVHFCANECVIDVLRHRDDPTVTVLQCLWRQVPQHQYSVGEI